MGTQLLPLQTNYRPENAGLFPLVVHVMQVFVHQFLGFSTTWRELELGGCHCDFLGMGAILRTTYRSNSLLSCQRQSWAPPLGTWHMTAIPVGRMPYQYNSSAWPYLGHLLESDHTTVVRWVWNSRSQWLARREVTSKRWIRCSTWRMHPFLCPEAPM